jgi:hypothetical protein
VRAAFTREGWLFELKHDDLPSGYRAPTAARIVMLLEVIDEKDSEGCIYA